MKSLSVLLLATAVAISSAQQNGIVDIDEDSCRWVGGDFGDTSECNDDEVIYGSCGSGSDPDCSGGDYYDMIYCCELEASSTSGGFSIVDDTCEELFGDFGEDLSCPGNGDALERSFVTAICGSGRDDDCVDANDNNYSHMIRCCEGEFGNNDKLYSTGECSWQYGDFGDELICNSQSEAVFGRCGSGRDPDCDGSDNYHGIQCCTIIKF